MTTESPKVPIATEPTFLELSLQPETERWLRAMRALTGALLEIAAPGEGSGVPIVANGETIAMLRLQPYSPALDAERMAVAARILSELAEQSLTRRDLVAQTARLWKELNFLTGVATSLTARSTREETARLLLSRIARLFGVERASILLRRDDGRLVVAAALGLAATLEIGAVIPLGGIAHRVLESGEPVLVENLEQLRLEEDLATRVHRDARTNSFLSVPILSNGVPLGVINVTDRRGGRPFRTEDRKLIAAIAAQAGIAFANVRLLEEARHTEGLNRELDLAARIQRSLLPQGPFEIPGWDVFGTCEPAAYVGGDAFHISTRDGLLWAAVLDVSGHGISAALLLASAYAALRALISTDAGPADAARSLNALMAADVGDTGMFVTGALLLVDGDGFARLCSLGHPPVFVRRSSGDVETFRSGGAPAGIVDDERYQEDRFTLQHGDTVLLYTDGLSEATSSARPFGEEGLAGWLGQLVPRGVEDGIRSLFGVVHAHRGQALQADDMAAVLIRRA